MRQLDGRVTRHQLLPAAFFIQSDRRSRINQIDALETAMATIDAKWRRTSVSFAPQSS
jgi:hypothetical protein